MIDYTTFNTLYEKAAESSSESKFILECGWQSWMKSSENTALDLLKEIYRLSKGGITAIVETFPTMKACSEEFSIPYKSLQKWVIGTYKPTDYLVKMMAYTIAIKATIKEETIMDIREKIVDAIVDVTERALNGNSGNYYSAYIDRSGRIYIDEETDSHTMPEAVYNGKDRTICSIQSAELWGSDEEKYDTYASYLDEEQRAQLAAYIEREKDNYDYEARAGIEYIETTFPEIAEEADRSLKNDILNDLRYRLENGTSEYEDTISEIVEWLEP